MLCAARSELGLRNTLTVHVSVGYISIIVGSALLPAYVLLSVRNYCVSKLSSVKGNIYHIQGFIEKQTNNKWRNLSRS